MTCQPIPFSSRPSSVYRRQAHPASIDRREPDIVTTINRLGSRIRYLGLLLKSFSTLNYQLPFLDEFGFLAAFKSSNKNYVSFARQHQTLVSHYNRGSIDRYLEQRPLQNEELCRIEDTIEKVKSALKTFLDLLDRIKICHDCERCLDYVVQLRQEIERGPEGLNRQNWNACTGRLSETLENAREWMRNQKQESLEEVHTLDPYYGLCPERPFYESLGPDAGEVLDEQYFVGCLMRGRREFEWIDKTLEDIYKTYRSEWNLPKEDFKELAFLKRIIRPDRLQEAMEVLYDCQDAAYDQHVALISRLKQGLGEVFAEAIRVQKAITIYKKWQSELNGCIRRHSGNRHDRSGWAKAYTITQLLSYEKTRFMSRMFHGGQYADVVVKALETYVSYVKNKSPQEKLAFLQRVRDRCLEKNRKLEEALYRLAGIQSVFDKKYIASLFALGISEQPAYQLALLTNRMISENVYGFGKDDIPEDLQHAGGHLAGMMVFSIEHIMSSWLGGSYALISSLNRCLFANLDPFIRCTEALDALSQKVLEPALSKGTAYAPESMRSAIKWLQDGVRWDEEGLRGKEAYLQRLSELLIAIGLTGGQHVLPTAVAFSLARLLSGAARRVSTWTLHTGRFSSRSAAEKIGYFIQFLSFPLVYQYGFKVGAEMFPEREEMLVSDALDVLGLSSSATDREILDARRHLMLKYHPDKNRGANATHLEELVENFQRVQAAFEVLQKEKL
ncbi:MAG: J domain-containing protein [Waddliaceae bacterium]